MNKFIFFILLFTAIFSACENVDLSQVSDEDLERLSDKAVVCEKPYIRFGTTCCLDENENGICDRDDSEKEKTEIYDNFEENVGNKEIDVDEQWDLQYDNQNDGSSDDIDIINRELECEEIHVCENGKEINKCEIVEVDEDGEIFDVCSCSESVEDQCEEKREDYIHIYVFTDGAKVELEIDGTYEEYSTDSNKNGYIMDEISERYGLGHYYAHTITKSFYDEDMFQSLTIRVEEDEIRVSMLFYDNTGTGQTYSEGQSLDYVFENIANFYGIDKEILREKSTIKYYNDSDSDDDYSELIPEKVKFSLGEDETTTITLGEYDYTFKYGDVTEDDSVTNTQINYLILGDRKVFEDVEPHGTKIKVMVLDTYYSSRDGVQSYADFIVGNYNWKLETTDVDNLCVERTYPDGLDYVISPNKEQTEVVIKEDYCKDTSTLIKYGCIEENGIEYYQEYEDECSHPEDVCSEGICLTCGVGSLESGKVTLQVDEEYTSTIGTPLKLLSVEDNSIILQVGTAGNVTIEGDCNEASIASYTFKLHESTSSGFAEFSYSIDYGINGGGSGSGAGSSNS